MPRLGIGLGLSRGKTASAGFVPTDLAGLQAWYDSSGLVTNTTNTYGVVDASNKVSQWSDLSGNGYHLDTGNVAEEPTFAITGSSTSAPTVEFAVGDNLFYTHGSDMWATQTTGEFIIVAEVGDPTNTFFMVGHSRVASDVRYGQHLIGKNQAGQFIAGTTERFRELDDNVANTLQVHTHSQDAVKGKIYTNNVEVTPLDTDTDAWISFYLNQRILSVGATEKTTPAYSTTAGKISEVIYSNVVLTASERASLQTYLANKYSI